MGSIGRVIGEGRTAQVFEWEAGRVLKLNRPGFPADWIRHEAALVRALSAAGLPVPAVHEVVEVEGRLGYVCERLQGESMMRRIAARPWLGGREGRRLARLHRTLHAAPAPPALPRLRDRLAYTLRDERVRALLGADAGPVLARLEALPEGDAVCHFDFHPDNVLGTGREARIIDWVTAAAGAPAADAARTLLILETPYLPPSLPAALRPVARGLKRWVRRAYLREYLRGDAGLRAAIAAWRVPVAAGRLWEDVPGERAWLLGLVRRGLAADRPGLAPGSAA